MNKSNRVPWLIVGLAIVLMVIAYFALRGGSVEADDFEQKAAEAAAAGKPMLLYFTADWCPPCRRMKRDIWPDPSVQAALAEHVVMVTLDVDTESGRSLGNRYQVASIPTMMVVNPEGELLSDAQGRPLRRVGGMKQPQVMVSFLRSIPGAADESDAARDAARTPVSHDQSVAMVDRPGGQPARTTDR